MISYGYSVKENDDSYVDLVESAVHQFSETSEPGAFMVDAVPLRKPHSLHRLTPGNTDSIFLFLSSNSTRNRYSTSACFFLLFVPYTRRRQYDMCQTGSLERDGK